MRTHWLPLIVLLTASPAAADSAIIPLHHLPAIEVERQLLPAEGDLAGLSGWVAGREQGLVPPGITAWTVDERQNAFEVVGSPEGIQSFRQIVQLLDVPGRQVRLSVRVLPLVDGGLHGLAAEPFPPRVPCQPQTEFGATATRDQLAVLDTQAALMSSEMTVSSSHFSHLFWRGRQDQPAEPTTLMPRVNSDGSVTLYISRPGLSLAGQQGVLVLRRVAQGQGGAVISRSLGTALVFEVQEVLPAVASH